eukprot:1937525-Amphidinium_carterae.1
MDFFDITNDESRRTSSNDCDVSYQEVTIKTTHSYTSALTMPIVVFCALETSGPSIGVGFWLQPPNANRFKWT